MFSEAQTAQLKQGAAEWNLVLDEPTLVKFGLFADRLEETNRTFNLTRVPPEEYVPLHFLDSLALVAVLPNLSEMRLLDVGTGAGFPGLPLALAFPELDVTLMDGTRKRLDFLDTVIRELNIPNARTLHGRAEELARNPDHRASYSLVAARAVSKLPQLLEWLLPLVQGGGRAICYKSQDIAEEIVSAAPVLMRLHGKIEETADVAIPGTTIVRKLVLVRRQAQGLTRGKRR